MNVLKLITRITQRVCIDLKERAFFADFFADFYCQASEFKLEYSKLATRKRLGKCLVLEKIMWHFYLNIEANILHAFLVGRMQFG